MDEPMACYARVESAWRTLELLKELSRQNVSSLDRLHRMTGLPKPTVVRLLETLISAGYVTNDRRQGGYKITSLVQRPPGRPFFAVRHALTHARYGCGL
jgi:IclR family transcriptional regulator, mhp operon transcriptional activator